MLPTGKIFKKFNDVRVGWLYIAAGMGGSLRHCATSLRCRASVFRFRNF